VILCSRLLGGRASKQNQRPAAIVIRHNRYPEVKMQIRAKNFVVVDAPARMKKVFAVIPTDNIAEDLPHWMAELFSLEIPHLKIIIVDNASSDGTGEIAETLKELFQPDVYVIHLPLKTGLGAACLAGLHSALDHGAEYIIQMEAHFFHPPASLLNMLEQADRFDVVVGSQTVQGAELKMHGGKGLAMLGRRANNACVRLILDLQVKDALTGSKCWTRRALTEVLDHPIYCNGFFFQVEMAYLAERTGQRVKGIPIDFQEQQKSEQAPSTRIKLEAIWRAVQLRLRYRKVRLTRDSAPARQRLFD
jgi:dolichol-phosphate mannosyltransferase